MQYMDLKLVDYARLMGISYQTAWRRWKAGTLQGYQLPSRTIAIRMTVQQIASAIAGFDGDRICPVCDTSFEVKTEQSPSAWGCACPVCGWTVTPVQATPGLPETTLHLKWAKQMWGKLQSFVSGQASENRSGWFPNPSTPDLSLETRLDALQIQLQQAAEERMVLRDRLNWVLSCLEQANGEQIQPAFSQLSSKFSTTEAPTSAATSMWSEMGLDYTPLQALLVNGNWQDADALTWQLILQAMQREQAGWLSLDEIDRFPMTDLLTLNWLWHEYSGGQWGWTQQHAIWQSVGGDYAAFCDRVGWRVMGNWIYYSDLSFSTAIAGHLPAICWRKRSCYGAGGSPAAENETAWLTRYAACAAAWETGEINPLVIS
jgi:GUN4-like